MSDRKVFNLLFGARESDASMYTAAYEAGADINFAFEGRKATKGSGGRWYYGDLLWHAPDGVHGEKMDTLLMIAVKVSSFVRFRCK
jgi:4-diphosphocytidyl-2C-methyl-D-erythritol kinase